MQVACFRWFILQAALEKDKNLEQTVAGEIINEEPLPVKDLGTGLESVKQLTSQMNELAVSTNATIISPPLDSAEEANSVSPVQDIDKRIRALKKKVEFVLLAFAANKNEHVMQYPSNILFEFCMGE